VQRDHWQPSGMKSQFRYQKVVGSSSAQIVEGRSTTRPLISLQTGPNDKIYVKGTRTITSADFQAGSDIEIQLIIRRVKFFFKSEGHKAEIVIKLYCHSRY
jgi:hypothetical protein